MALSRFCSHCAAPLPGPPPVTCRSCDTSHWLDAKPCGGALVARGSQLLLVRRAHAPWRGAWDVPGGFCGPREHPRDAARREVREETGLDVRVGGILGIWVDTYADQDGDSE
jgi:8-oxo-dGTP pyrophosphatase MutT (NUDIX family)